MVNNKKVWNTRRGFQTFVHIQMFLFVLLNIFVSVEHVYAGRQAVELRFRADVGAHDIVYMVGLAELAGVVHHVEYSDIVRDVCLLGNICRCCDVGSLAHIS